MSSIGLIGFLIGVRSTTLTLKDLLVCLESIKELYELIGTLGDQVESLHEYLIFPLAQQVKLDKLDNFVIR